MFERKKQLGLLLILVLLGSTTLGMQNQNPAEIQKWIEELGDSDFSKRETAQKNLWAAGYKAEAALKNAAKGEDAEIRKRAIELLEKFKWGIYPDTPIAVIDLVESYQGATRDKKREYLEKLMDQKDHGARAIIKILQAEEQEESKNDALNIVSSQFSRFVSSLLEKDQRPVLKKLIGKMLQNRTEGSFSHFAAYALLSKNPEPLEINFQEWFDGKIEPELKNEMLSFWHRAHGAQEKALSAARESKNQDLVFNLLMEQGKWKAVLDQGHFAEMISPAKIGFRIALARLLFDSKNQELAFEELTDFAQSAIKDAKVETANQVFQSAKIALLNGYLENGTTWMDESRNKLMAMEIFGSRFDFSGAKKVLEASKNSKEFPVMEIQAARSLYSLGKKDESLKILEKYESQLSEKAEGDWPLRLVQTWKALKNKPKAMSIAAIYLEKTEHREAAGRVLKYLFDEDSSFMESILAYRWKTKPERKTSQTLEELETLLKKDTSKEQVLILVDELEDYSKTVTQAENLILRKTLTRLCQLYSLEEKLGVLASSHDKAETWNAFGEELLKAKKFSEASKAFQKAWEKSRSTAIYAYMTGKAFELSGDNKSSTEWYDKSFWIPLGDDQARTDFAIALAKASYIDEALRQYTLISLTGEPGSYYVGSAFRSLAWKSIQKKEFGKGALGYEKAMIRCMTPYVSFTQSSAYVSVPALAARLRAREACEMNDFKTCETWIKRGQEILPGEVELPILLYAALMAKNQKNLADSTFQVCKKSLDDLISQYPDCAWARNSAAWLSACCKTELDWGFQNAQKAVLLDSENAAHQDTLAEVYFQLGKKTEALEAQKKAVRLAPNKTYYQKQLKRIQEGNPNAERPEENEEDD